MAENVLNLLMLVGFVMILIIVSDKLKVAYPVLLVLAGLVISLIPGTPVIDINPEWIFILFLPPLLYEAAWANSLKELWKWRRIIGSFAFLVVFITAASVALVANWLIPGFSLALGFLLGGIVSPPDAVSVAAILKFVKVPKRVATILEGESLLNDASSLIIFRFAAIAVTTGQFIWYEAAGNFIWMVIGGAGIGFLLAFTTLKIHKFLPTDINMDVMVTLILPFMLYIVAEEVHASGVLSVVIGGLFVSYKRHEFLGASARIRGESVWHSLVFLLNGLVFVMIGLDLPPILEGLNEEGIDLMTAIGYGLIVTAVLIVTRILSIYGAVGFTLFIRNYIKVADREPPGVAAPLVLGWAGMRGVVSLAAALSIPMMANGEPFPQRNLILFITFVAILVTLVLQGLTLPTLIKKLKMKDFNDHLPKEETEKLIRETLSQTSLNFINVHYDKQLKKSYLLQDLKHHWEYELEGQTRISSASRHKLKNILNNQRKVLIELNKRPDIDEEIIREFLRRIDLEEEKWEA